MKRTIKEVIVAEGRDDEIAIKKAVDAEIITTCGFAFGKKLINLLKDIEKKRGIIIFTDSDYMGSQIRKRIADEIPSAKHAYLSQNVSTKHGDIGVENASPEEILKALKAARATKIEVVSEYTMSDLIENRLINSEDASARREKLSEILKIGYGNGKKTLHKLNSFGITRDEFEEAMKEVNSHR
ncbi:ribonuclease M5 [Peptoniphilus sp. AGMB00490]|uniref:Ribonuclease M5 n=2 Tax=Peptoniphilus TaxID=162289 RepID=A0ACD6AZH8_9FIRM|nr:MULTISPECIES: ribonuclease M5 [Peptoniphilus]NMW84475.1 ribonuclease M5 [Peptoniphilus faecalis]OLR64965.1 ribonuclease M5 [Peptoniphilus porci]